MIALPKAPKAAALKAAAIFLAFLFASVSLLAGSSKSSSKSLGTIRFGTQKIEITYGPNLDPHWSKDARLMQPLADSAQAAEAKRFAQVIQRIANFAPEFAVPPRMHIRLRTLDNNASAIGLFQSMQLPRRFAVIGPGNKLYNEHPDGLIAIVAHEFGHILFHENVLKKLGFVASVQNQIGDWPELALTIWSLEEQIRILEDRGNAGDIAAGRRAYALAREREQWETMLEGEMKALEPVLEMIRATSPYNEFYADVVAVLYTEEPNAISDALHIAMPNGTARQQTIGRVSLRNRAFEKKGTLQGRIVPAGHNFLSQTRGFLWEEYLSRPTVMKTKKAEVLAGLGRAISSELRWYLSWQGMPRDPANIAEVNAMNQRFIAAIRKELSRL